MSIKCSVFSVVLSSLTILDLHNTIQIRGEQINIYRNHPAVITRAPEPEEPGTDFSLRLCVNGKCSDIIAFLYQEK